MAFTKSLTLTDIESKLTVPNNLFSEFFPAHGGGVGDGDAVNIFVRNQNGLTWTFRLSCIQASGSKRYKRIVSAGWLSFVRDRKLKIGDVLSIFKEHGNSDRILYKIEVKRRSENSKVNGSDEWTRLV